MAKKILFFTVVLFLSFTLTHAVSAQEMYYTYGAVQSTAGESLVLTEYDFMQDQNIESIYELDENTELTNFASIEDLMEGTEVEIDFTLAEDGTKHAVVISLYQETDTSDETDENLEIVEGEGEAAE